MDVGLDAGEPVVERVVQGAVVLIVVVRVGPLQWYRSICRGSRAACRERNGGQYAEQQKQDDWSIGSQ